MKILFARFVATWKYRRHEKAQQALGIGSIPRFLREPLILICGRIFDNGRGRILYVVQRLFPWPIPS